jgi:hypothetical protein
MEFEMQDRVNSGVFPYAPQGPGTSVSFPLIKLGLPLLLFPAPEGFVTESGKIQSTP